MFVKTAFAVVASLSIFSSYSHASDKTVSSTFCYVKESGRYTGETVMGDEFFSKANHYSNRNNTCVVAKIYGEASTSRIYLNGRRYGKRSSGMSNSEVESELYSLGLRQSNCVTFSCDESAY